MPNGSWCPLIQSWGRARAVHQPFYLHRRRSSSRSTGSATRSLCCRKRAGIEGIRPGGNPRRSITRSFRALPELLAFINDLFGEIARPGARPDDFTYDEADRFPVDAAPDVRGPVLGLAVADEPEQCAAAVAEEIVRILREDDIRDRQTGVVRPARPGDIAILFRSRTSHREFQYALEQRGVPAYVYKGLGFFDADEIKDVSVLIRYLAEPSSDLRAAAFLRSRFVRLSDAALARLRPALAAALTDRAAPGLLRELDVEDQRVLAHVRAHVGEWLVRVDRVPPADLVEHVLATSRLCVQLRGPRRQQARRI